MNWVCYLLRCADGTLYCGITNDLDKRLAAHNAGGGAKYTRTRTPVELVFSDACADRSTASMRESQIKIKQGGETATGARWLACLMLSPPKPPEFIEATHSPFDSAQGERTSNIV